LSTFKERESKEDRYAWTKFKQWLDKGEWKVKRFRYAKEISSLDINRLSLPEDQKIFFKGLLKSIDFDHDGIMSRGPETWFFDLKYKSKPSSKTLVNEDDYKSYYELSEACGVPFIIVAYVHFNEDGTLHDKLYFHRVRDPETEPKPRRFWDKRPAEWGGQKWVYEMPETEYCLITGFDVPFERPKTLLDYYVFCRKIDEAYKAWRDGRSFTPRPDKMYREEILREMEQGYPGTWGKEPFEVPKWYTKEEKLELKEQIKRKKTFVIEP